jgi:hypothetical protein
MNFVVLVFGLPRGAVGFISRPHQATQETKNKRIKESKVIYK